LSKIVLVTRFPDYRGTGLPKERLFMFLVKKRTHSFGSKSVQNLLTSPKLHSQWYKRH